MKKTAAKKSVKKVIKNKARSKALSAASRVKAKAAAAKAVAARRAHPTVKKASTATKARTLSLNDRHVTSWRDRFMKLGRNIPHSPEAKPRLILDNYLMASSAPATVDFASQVVDWPMYGNDQIGDCTAACAGHQIQAWTRYTGTEVDIPEPDIIQLYSAVSGYDPATGANDNGAVIQDVLTYWRKSGVPVAGHKILAFAQLKDLSQVKQALWLFGSVYLGVNVPQSALDQFNNDQPWTVVQNSPIEGGHAIPLQYAGDGNLPYQVVTWGKLQGMDQHWFDAYVEEAWIVITDDWLNKNGNTPEGFNLQQLGADLANLTGDPNPFPAPVPPAPVPTPVPVPPAPVPVPVPPVPVPPAPVPPAPVPPAPEPDAKAVLEAILAFAEAVVVDIKKVL
jgi:hypothetical protein